MMGKFTNGHCQQVQLHNCYQTPLHPSGQFVWITKRFLWAFQSREVYWSDQENNNTWTASATNQAGQITLQTTGQIVCAEKIRGGI